MSVKHAASGARPAIREALPAEAGAVADLWLASRRAAAPAIPPAVHSEAEVRGWFREVVLPSLRDEVWVIGPDGAPEAMMVLQDDWVDQLYVTPARQGHGLGGRLIRFAQDRRERLALWTFEANLAARAFYEAHGFAPNGPPDSDNEEGAPAILYRWQRGFI